MKKLLCIALVAFSSVVVDAESIKVSGFVRQKDLIIGTAGSVNRIRLWIGQTETGPYVSQTVLCSRSNQTLGFCDPVHQGNYVVVAGDGYNLEGDLFPVTSLSIKPTPVIP